MTTINLTEIRQRQARAIEAKTPNAFSVHCGLIYDDLPALIDVVEKAIPILRYCARSKDPELRKEAEAILERIQP